MPQGGLFPVEAKVQALEEVLVPSSHIEPTGSNRTVEFFPNLAAVKSFVSSVEERRHLVMTETTKRSF